MADNVQGSGESRGKPGPSQVTKIAAVAAAMFTLLLVCLGVGPVVAIAGLTALGNHLESKFQKVSESVESER